jgi:hypothetical protein
MPQTEIAVDWIEVGNGSGAGFLQTPFDALPIAPLPLTGNEIVVVEVGGVIYQTTTSAIAALGGGAIQTPVRIITLPGNVSVQPTDQVVVIRKATGQATGVTLTTGPQLGQRVVIKDGRGDAGLNPITISAAAGTIDGAATQSIQFPFGVLTFIYNGTEWNIIT